METDWTQDLLDWLTANPGWAGFWVFVMSFVESLAFVGILVPGIIILFGLGALIGLGESSGEQRAVTAVENAIMSPLLQATEAPNGDSETAEE